MNKPHIRNLAIALTFVAACGGKTPPAGSPTASGDAPDWVHRGSHIEKGRLIGVGQAGGINNVDLARTTATNRGRNEIAKILETYSASLMKDYQEHVSSNGASDESQMVTQAVKTFTNQLLEGTEVQGYWLDSAQNTWFGLVVLDFEKQKEVAAAKANMPGKFKDWVDQNGSKVLGGLEDEMPKNPPPPSNPTADATPPAKPAKPAPAAPKPGPEPKVGGTPPAWTKKDSGGACDSNKFLCGVGTGNTMQVADNGARAELGRIFESNVKSVATSFESAASKISSKTGEKWVETQNVTNYSMVSSDKLITMSEIQERWQDSSNKFWTLAVINRAQASTALREQIEEKDNLIGGLISRASGSSDKIERFKSLKQALVAMAEREALNSDLRVIEKSGQGVPSPHNIGEITSQFEDAAANLSVGIAVSGSGSDQVQACLEEGLTAKGYQVEAKSSEEEDDDPDVSGKFDVVLKGSVKADKRGQIAGSEVVNISFTLKLINGSNNKVLKTLTANKKASRGDVKSAASTAARQLCTQKMPELVAGIDEYFGKKK
ncbi:MAG: LPP20 family lipoprotein [Myxococcota bacterium]